MEEGLSASLSLLSLISLLLILSLALSSLFPAIQNRNCVRMAEVREELLRLADSLDLDASDYLKGIVGC